MLSTGFRPSARRSRRIALPNSRSESPLPEVTTSSLTALKEYAEGRLIWHQGKYPEGVTALWRAAVDADPGLCHGPCRAGEHLLQLHRTTISPRASVNTTKRWRFLLEPPSANAFSFRQTMRMTWDMWSPQTASIASASNAIPATGKSYPTMLICCACMGGSRKRSRNTRKSCALHPTMRHNHLEMATAYRSLGKLPEALGAYRRRSSLIREG